ncbi:MAG: hypothetical protein U9Q73_01810 [Nanoarchaeota archaeon]|nr:hypothetical protein [Nanoarchaeota archaeon]
MEKTKQKTFGDLYPELAKKIEPKVYDLPKTTPKVDSSELVSITSGELEKLKENNDWWKKKYKDLKNTPNPDYNMLMQYCISHSATDLECEQMFRMGSTAKMFNQTFGQQRGGGGWSGAIKGVFNILNKMRQKGLIK